MSNSPIGRSPNHAAAPVGSPRWPKLFQNLRSTRETELADDFPMHASSANGSGTHNRSLRSTTCRSPTTTSQKRCEIRCRNPPRKPLFVTIQRPTTSSVASPPPSLLWRAHDRQANRRHIRHLLSRLMGHQQKRSRLSLLRAHLEGPSVALPKNESNSN